MDTHTGPAPPWAMFCLHGALLGRTHWATASRVGRAGDGPVTVWRGLGDHICHCSKLKRGMYSILVFLLRHLDCTPPTALPSTYRQNKSRERGELAGVFVNPLLQLLDGPCLKCSVS